MFTRSDGPTALRADLVRALAFSQGTCVLSTPDGPSRAVAAVASVWNGKKGFVAVLFRHLQPPRIERFIFADPIPDLETLKVAEGEALAFAERQGFSLDNPAFFALSDPEQAKRLAYWNRFRKVRRKQAAPVSGPLPALPPVGDIDPSDATPDPTLVGADPTPTAARPPAVSSGESADEGRAVLGKLELVRRGKGDEPPPLPPLIRLLSYY